ncbi:exochitinase [Cordyceps fumosorosea ARSEF 2679]|uniref:Beta-hexosaminidase n=1 Tax=Cordyceps fumosorosea (strain ARSEF 2679) TaxID=1081104 RepID=A0A167R2Q1_CORFA|nr:exochitinase [Cordyceps fumosorosea ARSEF 2679]OAA58220.1 exochitinase [Cordyceps fumosorosea ARSEF 2679]
MLSKSLAVAAGLLLAAAGPAAAIWPIPSESSTGNGVLFMSADIKVTLNGAPLAGAAAGGAAKAVTRRADDAAGKKACRPRVPAGNGTDAGNGTVNTARISDAVSRTLDVILKQGFVPWMLHDANSDFEPPAGSGNGTVRTLALTQTGKDPRRPTFETMDESYALNLTLAGHASITAATSVGLLRGLETFTQLFFKQSSSSGVYTNMAPVTIKDAPSMKYRALLVDVARHWYSVADVKRAVDGLAMNKMNVLHLHATDTQSWPLEVPALPLLAEKHRYAKGLTYSPADVQEIHEYAAARGVQVITEIDMPGHVGIDRAYPGLSNAFNAQPWNKYCAEPPCGSLKLNDTAVDAFLDKLFDDVLPRLAPHAAYFHTGGDEYKASNSLLDPALKTDDKAVLRPLLHAFLDRVHKRVRDHGLTPLVWEEMVDEWAAPLPTNDTIVQAWLGRESVRNLTRAGYRVVDTTYTAYYLDCGRGTWIDVADAAIKPSSTFDSWCDPYKNWRVVYNYDPLEGLDDKAAERVLGGEVALWSETVDGSTFDQIAWPRAAAGGEVWWSGRKDAEGKMRSVFEARPRLSEMRERMLARGIVGETIAPLFCTQSKLGECV